MGKTRYLSKRLSSSMARSQSLSLSRNFTPRNAESFPITSFESIAQPKKRSHGRNTTAPSPSRCGKYFRSGAGGESTKRPMEQGGYRRAQFILSLLSKAFRSRSKRQLRHGMETGLGPDRSRTATKPALIPSLRPSVSSPRKYQARLTIPIFKATAPSRNLAMLRSCSFAGSMRRMWRRFVE